MLRGSFIQRSAGLLNTAVLRKMIALKGADLKTTQISEERILSQDIFEGGRRSAPRNGAGTWTEPSREIPVYHRCEVLVVGAARPVRRRRRLRRARGRCLRP